jgi:nickel/cobalt transporter (NicO) family protein
MPTSSVMLLVMAAAAVAVLHSILPDHWVPLAVVARTQRWSILHVARISALASAGHVLASVVLAGVVAVVGLQFQHQLDVQQGHLVGIVLVLTGLGFLLWELTRHSDRQAAGHGHSHTLGVDRAYHQHGHDDQHHSHEHEEHEEHGSEPAGAVERSLGRRLARIAIPFGVAASPDLTILPVALAASAVGRAPVAGVLLVFAVVTMATFAGLTVLATLAGYQVKGEWLEQHATTITALVLIGIGVVAYVGF